MFFDAVPTEVPQLELDVLTPHFPQWYSGQNSPSDDQEPKPVLFLTVAPKSKFLFALAGPEADVNRAKEWLTLGLTELGAGAKTAAGYGWFDEFDEAS